MTELVRDEKVFSVRISHHIFCDFSVFISFRALQESSKLVFFVAWHFDTFWASVFPHLGKIWQILLILQYAIFTCSEHVLFFSAFRTLENLSKLTNPAPCNSSRAEGVCLLAHVSKPALYKCFPGISFRDVVVLLLYMVALVYILKPLKVWGPTHVVFYLPSGKTIYKPLPELASLIA